MSKILLLGYRLITYVEKNKRTTFGMQVMRNTHAGKTAESTLNSVRSMYKTKEKKVDIYSLFMLVIPVSAFALGTWQVQRKKWKESLIADLASRTTLEPVDFPEDLSELSAMEFHPVRVVGTFDHSNELHIGPRSLIVKGESASTGGSIISTGQTGFQVVTPFKLEDRDLTILVNRGWVPQKSKNPNTRAEGQVTGPVELVGVVRHAEERQPLTPQNKPNSGLWLYRDLNKMAEVTNAAPIFLDALDSSTVPGGPIGGQTRITLRNEHLSYILTWYGLSAATAVMWYRHFIMKIKPV